MNDTEKATPTPWTRDDGTAPILGNYRVRDANGNTVLYSDTVVTPEYAIDLIVQRVNSYAQSQAVIAQLVEKLKIFQKQLGMKHSHSCLMDDSNTCICGWSKELEKFDELIAKAESLMAAQEVKS